MPESIAIREHLTAYVNRELLSRKTHVGLDDELLVSGLIDSIGVMTLLLFIENELDVQVPPEDVTIDNFESIRAIEAYVLRSRAGVNQI